MKLNKIIPLSLVALMGAGGLSGCSSYDPNAVIVWATAAEQQVVNAVVEEYNKNANDADKITINYKAVTEGDAGTEVGKDPSGDRTADLFLVADDQIYNLQGKGAVYDLTSTYGAAIREANTEASVTGASYNNKIYGFPVTNDNGYFLWYNGDELTENDVQKLESILAKTSASKKLLLNLEDGWYAPTLFLSPDTCGLDSLRWKENSDGDVIYEIKDWDADGKGVDVAQAFRSLVTANPGEIITGGNGEIVSGFEDGSVIAAVSGTWMLNDLSAVCSNLKAVKLPTIRVGTKDCQMGSFTGSKVYCVNAAKSGELNDTKRAKAIKLADALTKKDAQLKRFQMRATIPCNKAALQDSAYTSNVDIGAKALQSQVQAAGAIQSLSAEGRYWNVGAAIGKALLDGDFGEYPNLKAFLKGECDILRNPGA